jgi:hypothetical protein
MLLYLVAAMRPTPKQWEEMGGVSMKLYGALGWPTRMETMSTPQLAEALELDAMKLHLAERDPQHHSWAKSGVDRNKMQLRILLSYHYYKDTDLDALFAKYFTAPYPEVFADSGAFSAASQGAHIDIADYAAWVKRWAHLLTVHSNLDVIGDAAATDRNQKTLEDMGLDPLPVFHTGSDMAHLDGLLDRYQYIALGGMVPYMRFPKRIMPWLIKCFKLAQGRAVFHGFGATSWSVVKSFPWYSVDSSSWGSGFRYGQVPVFNTARGKFETLSLGKVKEWQEHARLVTQLGFDWRDFADRKRNDRAKICAISALSYMMAEQWLRQRHGEIYIPGRASAPGRRAHLVTADSTSSNMGAANLSESLRKHGLGETLQGAGERLHLADTSNGVNYSDADRGLKLHLADSRPFSGGDLAAAESGIKVHQTASLPSQQTEWRSWSSTQSGVKLHLAEHSLDRGGGRGYKQGDGDIE